MNDQMLSIVIPAKNEGDTIGGLLAEIKKILPDAEVIVVNDGSTDNTSLVCKEYSVVEVLHPYSKGNGSAIKSGARAATRENIVFMDADGQHQPKDIPVMLDKMDEGYDMVVGTRTKDAQASVFRALANGFYNKFSSWIVNQEIKDLTSGFRLANRKKFLKFLYLLPNGFSYPTTSTMLFFRAGFNVAYQPVEVLQRDGSSHINLYSDGIKFLLIIFKIGTLYSPMKIFFPIAVAHAIAGFLYYLYTYLSHHAFTNMGVLLFVSSVTIFLVGLVSEQVSSLHFKESE